MTLPGWQFYVCILQCWAILRGANYALFKPKLSSCSFGEEGAFISCLDRCSLVGFGALNVDWQAMCQSVRNCLGIHVCFFRAISVSLHFSVAASLWLLPIVSRHLPSLTGSHIRISGCVSPLPVTLPPAHLQQHRAADICPPAPLPSPSPPSPAPGGVTERSEV